MFGGEAAVVAFRGLSEIVAMAFAQTGDQSRLGNTWFQPDLSSNCSGPFEQLRRKRSTEVGNGVTG
ncbi:hypothetical protein PTKU64_89560 [Paraburkholderia terrae]|uniref:Uncharacterized protein n=1 Tax=Paraburkholderia terrae TaxID=311230 RepID=A0ABM7UAT5_9BURK|nr:hypothetical protein PTKU64_88770 [Paraburkholderia terrae]BCZ85281.1 hypothetical protein PTKU64_89560 [Paraburkholderia terrae]BDC45583.1 hypothetical protein PTKU15_88800 [Paraburkholderia terrae]